ncbi:MAG TPA: YqaA family protein [Sandaracinaceae bacterium LLY-WYZ-13_1]|nr:YqaA family protein [Sandaracinaceae bacterium LLY-WYZ-13_1]
MSGEEQAVAERAPIPWYRWPTDRLRRLYDWTLHWADTKYAVPALGILAFVEASFFPIPPDVLLMAMALGKPKKAFWFAGICTAGSVLGAILGWYIGVGLWHALGVFAECPEFGGGAWLFRYVPGFSCEKFATVQGLYEENALLYLFAAAFTPIPFKVFTIAAGVFRIALPTLLAASAVGRAGRFFLVAGLIHFFGPKVRVFIERRFELLTLVFTALLLGGFLLVKYAM